MQSDVLAPRDGIAIDFETYYDKEYSVRLLSTWNYVYDQRFDAYLVAVVGPGINFVGHPKEFDWTLIDAKVWAAHNAGFEALVVRRLQELGVIPDVKPLRWFDTADLAVWQHCGKRDLVTAAKYLLGVEVSKAVRTKMQGRKFWDLDAAERDEVLKYGTSDAQLCYDLMQKYYLQWPLSEQEISNVNLRARIRGVPGDRDAAEHKAEEFKTRKWELEAQLPWVAEDEKPMSPKAAREQGRRDGIPVPANFDSKNPDVLKWELDYGQQFPWVTARREYSRVNTFLKKVQNFRDGIRADGTLYYEMKYMGAGITGRFSGGGDSGQKFNIHNMTRNEILRVVDDDTGEEIEGSGIHLRSMIVAPKGWVIGVQDYCQIEARLLLWRAGDIQTLALIRDHGMNIYEAYARTRLGWAGGPLKKENPELYQLAKALVLGAGYYCGGRKFRMAAKLMAGLDISEDHSRAVIQQYRAANPKIVEFWKEHQRWLQYSAQEKDDTHEVVLASGRRLVYHHPRITGVDEYGRQVIRAQFGMGGKMRKLHGGLLTENEIQATGRDILVDAWLALERLDVCVLFTLHDEFVYLLKQNEASDVLKETERVITTSSPWAEGCPIAVETSFSEVYE